MVERRKAGEDELGKKTHGYLSTGHQKQIVVELLA